jgi:hypothetical protein
MKKTQVFGLKILKLQTYYYSIYFVKFNPTPYALTGSIKKIMTLAF